MLSSLGFAADVQFSKRAIQFVAQHFSLDASQLRDSLNEDAFNYLRISSQLYEKSSSNLGGEFPSAVLGVFGNLGNWNISMGNLQIVGHHDGSVSINGVKQKAHINNIQELENALNKGHWFSVSNCMVDIAVAAQKVLVLSERPENLELAKAQATSRFLSSELRAKLLGVIAEHRGHDLVDWLLKQEDFNDSARDKLIQAKVDSALDSNKPVEAGSLIKKYLQSGYNAQESASKKLFYYHFNRGELAEADKIIVGHFSKGYNAYETLAKVMFEYYFDKGDFLSAERMLEKHYSKGYNAYENLARILFNHHLEKNDLRKAESCLQRHFPKGYNSSDKLVKVLVDYLMDLHEYDQAREIAGRNMSVGYNEHTRLEKYIFEQQIAYLKSKSTTGK
jgi:hypothetical protein